MKVEDNSVAPNSSPLSESTGLIEELKRQASSRSPWPERFGRLGRAIAAKSFTEPTSQEIDCDECSSALALFVSDELEEEDVRHRYPLIQRHLDRCPPCREEHNLLYDTLSKERKGQLQVPDMMPVALSLSFLRPRPTETPWTVHIQREEGHPFRLSFNFPHSYLQSLFAAPLASPLRSVDMGYPEEPILLLSDVIRIGDDELAVEAMARRSWEQPDFFQVELTIGSTGDLPDNLVATLKWDGQERTSPVDKEGRAHFTDIPLGKCISPAGEKVSEVSIEIKQRGI
ncbi:MAG: zf-HC2 domain-containing protein [Anaerolineae bacterium]